MMSRLTTRPAIMRTAVAPADNACLSLCVGRPIPKIILQAASHFTMDNSKNYVNTTFEQLTALGIALNRGGDRAANSALHIIAIGRLRTDARTKAYVERRVSEGHSKLEAIRCLKRYIAREVYYVIRKRNRQIGQVQVAWKRPVPDNRQAFVI